MDFKIRDVANKHLKFRGKVRAGDTKLDCCSLIDWSKMGSNHVKTEVSVKFETFQDKDLLFTHSSTHTDYVYYLECVSSIILCVFINAAPFHDFLFLFLYTFIYFLHSAKPLLPVERLLWCPQDILVYPDSSALCEFDGLFLFCIISLLLIKQKFKQTKWVTMPYSSW